MKSSKGNTHEEEDDYEDDFTSKKEATSADAKKNEKVNVMRSKHSVTEQRRRSKINERFQILRDLMPHGDQKRDTASFLLEVIEYLQLLQEKVHRYEGSYQAWSTETCKLMPWRQSHWRVQNFLGPSPAPTFVGNFDEKSIGINPCVADNAQTPADADSNHDAFRVLDQQCDLGDKAAPTFMPYQAHIPAAVQSDGDDSHLLQRPASDVLLSPCAMRSDDLLGERAIEGGTISISSTYSHGLLTTFEQALQSSGVDLSQANISIQINLGKRAQLSSASGITDPKEQEKPVSQNPNIGHVKDIISKEDSDQPHKKLKK